VPAGIARRSAIPQRAADILRPFWTEAAGLNNCYANYGTTNAREIAAMLGAE
jgi:hypothetical protein